MAQVSSLDHPPTEPQNDVSLMDAPALRARCNRLHNGRHGTRDALWALRASFTVLQTHAESIELQNAELREAIFMVAENWNSFGVSKAYNIVACAYV